MNFFNSDSRNSTTSPAPLFAALVLVALVPAVGVLWFMTVAMRNERLAVQERLTAVYANHLASLQPRAAAFAKERQDALKDKATGSPSEIFAAIVRAGLADGVVIYDAAGKVLYPTATNIESASNENTESARALQSQAAELLNAGQKEPALAKLAELVGAARLRNAVGAQGALIVPNAQLLILKTLGSPSSAVLQPAPDATEARAEAPRYSQTLADLVARLNDYSEAAMPSSQRRFLMGELSGTNSGLQTRFPTFAAEELAAEYLEHDAPVAADANLSVAPRLVAASLSERTTDHSLTLAATGIPNVWRLPSADRTVVALMREERLRAELEKFLAPFVLPDVRVTVLAPSAALTAHTPALSQEAGELLPGWRLALGFRDGDPFAEASARQTQFYLWTGLGVVAIIAAVALLVARYVAAQVRLARLKNELVSTVSHELRTPLASMRALVDTLLAGRVHDERQLHDYLQLIAKENLRLSHLIENFLAFSRMERGSQRFQFEEVPPQEVVRLAVDALGDRLAAPQCSFSTRLAVDLPHVRADPDALATVLVNLLDNACKYTNGHKRIGVRAYADGPHVAFEVEDNGIGLARAEVHKIFARFYQVDQSLTRQRGGCGLGLSIVDYIVKAHDGAVEVDSQPGRGSTFRVKIPISEKEPLMDANP